MEPIIMIAFLGGLLAALRRLLGGEQPEYVPVRVPAPRARQRR